VIEIKITDSFIIYSNEFLFFQGAIISYTIVNTVLYSGFYMVSSLCNAALGSTAEGTTGRKRSVLLLTTAICMALWFQYSLGPSIVNNSKDSGAWRYYTMLPGLNNIIYKSWYTSCSQYGDNMFVLEQCAGNVGVYRPMAFATLFFIISSIASKIRPSLNKEVWPAKFSVRDL
jgi:hypothetical protein